VPTWNYVAVHARGSLEIFDDPQWVRGLVTSLTDLNEASFDQPWSVQDAPADYIESQLKGIVGIQMTIARLEGKWKVSQNRPLADRKRVIDALEPSEMASLIAERIKS
jgi:transcriptional regulator